MYWKFESFYCNDKRAIACQRYSGITLVIEYIRPELWNLFCITYYWMIAVVIEMVRNFIEINRYSLSIYSFAAHLLKLFYIYRYTVTLWRFLFLSHDFWIIAVFNEIGSNFMEIKRHGVSKDIFVAHFHKLFYI